MKPNCEHQTNHRALAQEFDHSPLMSRGTSRDYQSVTDQSSFAGVFSRGASRDYVDSIGERTSAVRCARLMQCTSIAQSQEPVLLVASASRNI